MSNISLKIGKRRFEKSEPLLIDWVEQLKAVSIINKEKKDDNEAALYTVLRIIGSYLDIPSDDILNTKLSADKITAVYNQIQESMMPYLNLSDYGLGKNINYATIRANINSILDLAKTLFLEKGILPDDFFNQSLKNFNQVINFYDKNENRTLDAHQVDESTF
jgi:hypothetical protein